MVNFASKFPNFRYHGNNGRPLVNFLEAIKMSDLQPPDPVLC